MHSVSGCCPYMNKFTSVIRTHWDLQANFDTDSAFCVKITIVVVAYVFKHSITIVEADTYI